jgi:hypothetical protein
LIRGPLLTIQATDQRVVFNNDRSFLIEIQGGHHSTGSLPDRYVVFKN